MNPPGYFPLNHLPMYPMWTSMSASPFMPQYQYPTPPTPFYNMDPMQSLFVPTLLSNQQSYQHMCLPQHQQIPMHAPAFPIPPYYFHIAQNGLNIPQNGFSVTPNGFSVPQNVLTMPQDSYCNMPPSYCCNSSYAMTGNSSTLPENGSNTPDIRTSIPDTRSSVTDIPKNVQETRTSKQESCFILQEKGTDSIKDPTVLTATESNILKTLEVDDPKMFSETVKMKTSHRNTLKPSLKNLSIKSNDISMNTHQKKSKTAEQKLLKKKESRKSTKQANTKASLRSTHFLKDMAMTTSTSCIDIPMEMIAFKDNHDRLWVHESTCRTKKLKSNQEKKGMRPTKARCDVAESIPSPTPCFVTAQETDPAVKDPQGSTVKNHKTTQPELTSLITSQPQVKLQLTVSSTLAIDTMSSPMWSGSAHCTTPAYGLEPDVQKNQDALLGKIPKTCQGDEPVITFCCIPDALDIKKERERDNGVFYDVTIPRKKATIQSLDIERPQSHTEWPETELPLEDPKGMQLHSYETSKTTASGPKSTKKCITKLDAKVKTRRSSRERCKKANLHYRDPRLMRNPLFSKKPITNRTLFRHVWSSSSLESLEISEGANKKNPIPSKNEECYKSASSYIFIPSVNRSTEPYETTPQTISSQKTKSTGKIDENMLQSLSNHNTNSKNMCETEGNRTTKNECDGKKENETYFLSLNGTHNDEKNYGHKNARVKVLRRRSRDAASRAKPLRSILKTKTSSFKDFFEKGCGCPLCNCCFLDDEEVAQL